MQTLALYIHWPFCLSKCPYCDFNSHVRDKVDHLLWQRAFGQELLRLRQITGPRHLSSIFFGGGTPSLMSPDLVAFIIEKAQTLWQASANLEITLEANPTSVESEKFNQLASAGVNRLSIGVQSFNGDALQFLGRHHSPDDAKVAIALAQKYVKRVSFDLIYARPQQTVAEWSQELDQALSLGTTHLSLYQLTIEPGTAFATRYLRGDFQLPDEDIAIALYETTIEKAGQAGLYAYEVSNFACPSQESAHNLAYWRYQDYAGIGPGAHGRLTLSHGKKVATKQFRAPETWLKQVLEKGIGDEEMTSLTLEEQTYEQLLMGLRLSEPFDLAKLPRHFGEVINDDQLSFLKREGFIRDEHPHILLTSRGRLCLNTVVEKLLR